MLLASFLQSSIKLIDLLFSATNQNGPSSQLAEAEVQSGRMSKRQRKIIEKNLQREEKHKEGRSYSEAPQKSNKADEIGEGDGNDVS